MRASHALSLAALAAILVTTPARAQNTFTFSVNPSFGLNYFLSGLPQRFMIRGKVTDTEVQSGNIHNQVTMRTSLGVRYNKHVGIEAVFSISPSQLHSSNLDQMSVDVIGYGLAATYYQSLGKPGREVFLSVGGGLKRYDYFYFESWSENAMTWNVGTGINLPIDQRIAVHMEARDHISTFNSNIPNIASARQHDLTISIGFALSVNKEIM